MGQNLYIGIKNPFFFIFLLLKFIRTCLDSRSYRKWATAQQIRMLTIKQLSTSDVVQLLDQTYLWNGAHILMWTVEK